MYSAPMLARVALYTDNAFYTKVFFFFLVSIPTWVLEHKSHNKQIQDQHNQLQAHH